MVDVRIESTEWIHVLSQFSSTSYCYHSDGIMPMHIYIDCLLGKTTTTTTTTTSNIETVPFQIPYITTILWYVKKLCDIQLSPSPCGLQKNGKMSTWNPDFFSIKPAPSFFNWNRSPTANVRQRCMTKMLSKVTHLITILAIPIWHFLIHRQLSHSMS